MIEGYTIIDTKWYEGICYHLLEAKIYGDEVPSMVVDSNFNLICYTWDDLIPTLRDYFEE